MSSNLIKNALRDVIPTYEGEFPLKLVNHVQRLYSLSSSKINLKQQEEVARYHLSAILAVEDLLSSLGLPDTLLDKVPMLPTTSKKLLREMREIFINGSPSKSNTATPTKTRSRVSTPRSKRVSTPMATPSSKSAKKRLFSEEPKTPGTDSPTKRGRGRPAGALNRTTLEKMGQSPFQTASTTKVLTPFLSPNKKVHLSTLELIKFCNKFQIPQETTNNVLYTFSEYHNRIKHEWALLCGLVSLVFHIINHDVLSKKPGTRQLFFEKLHNLQNGALLRQSLTEWCNLISDFFQDAKWIKQLKFRYGYYSDSNVDIPSMGNMLLVNKIMQSEQDYQEWKSWACKRAQSAIK